LGAGPLELCGELDGGWRVGARCGGVLRLAARTGRTLRGTIWQGLSRADRTGNPSMQQTANDIRGAILQVTEGRLLLPNATVAEVITYSEPEPVPGAPDWVMGRIRWRGWRIPMVSFARLAGFSQVEGERGSKVAVLKALSGNPR